MSKQFQRTYCVSFLRCIELWTKAVLSSDPAFIKNIVVLRDREESKVESGKPAKTRSESHRNRWKRIIKSLGYSKNIRSFHWNKQTMKALPPFWIWQCHVVVRRPIRHFSPVKAKHSWTALRMSRPLFVGSYLQVT